MTRRGNGEGCIRQRKEDGRWLCSITVDEDGRRKRKVVYGRSYDEVLQAKIKLLANQQQGHKLQTNEREILSGYLDRWLVNAISVGVALNTSYTYERQLRLHVKPHLGDIRLTKLTTQDVRDWITKLSSKLSPKTIRLAYFILAQALDQAVDDELIPRNVAKSKYVKLPTPQRHHLTVLTPEQVKLFLESIKGHRLESLFALLLETGCRKGEAQALRHCDIDWEHNKIFIRGTLHSGNKKKQGKRLYRLDTTKTESSTRIVDVSPRLMSLLHAYKISQIEQKLRVGEKWNNEFDLLFTSSKGTPLEPTYIAIILNNLLEKAGLPKMNVHATRHSNITILLANGVSPSVVAKRVGHHSESTTTSVYRHVLKQEEDKATLTASRLLWGA